MTQEQILSEVANSDWQPEFEFTDDLDAVVDSILKLHEDYFLGLHNKVKEIIEREIECAQNQECGGNMQWVDDDMNGTDFYKCLSCGHIQNSSEYCYNDKLYQITFANVCDWQKELFEYKLNLCNRILNKDDGCNVKLTQSVLYLPNTNINLGLRTTNVKVGNWTPPAPMFLEELKEMCFPIKIENNILNLPLSLTYSVDQNLYKDKLTEWYKICMTTHFWNDLNGRLGGIVINILSFILTGKYLISKR